VAEYAGDSPWSFQTSKGIFSTPIIDGKGTIYVGSADHVFYALHPDGTEKWRFETGEIIDSAGALPRVDPQIGPTVIFPSGDGYLYHLRADDGALLWAFDARIAPRASYNNWWEGNIAIGYDGTYYAGNTNFNYYAINPDGSLRWTYETGSNNWSIAGLGDDGTLFWASNDTFVRAVRPDGVEQWTKRTLGFIAASAAIGSDGTVYIGSFDSYVYALEPETGRVKWKFKTNDHVYSSVALDEDAQGNTRAIYFGSTDGIFYALDPDGNLMWQYDTGDPIRSSPVVGNGPNVYTGDERIVYFGAGNGKLYALNAMLGMRRWSFDTTLNQPELRDRNDLNGSPALGETGIYIGGEHGHVWYVPYDYCLHNLDPRCTTYPGEDLPEDMAGLVYVTPGGSTESVVKEQALPASLERYKYCSSCAHDLPVISPEEERVPLPAATVITLRLLVREDGETVDAWVCSAPVGCPPKTLQVSVTPAAGATKPFSFTVEPSADGHYIHIIPEAFLEPNAFYTIDVQGAYYTGGLAVGNLTLGGHKRGWFEDSFTFRTAAPTASQVPLEVTPEYVTALEWTRLATPIPSMLPSLNQIGFDYMDWIIGTVDISAPDADGQGKMILWAVGGRRNADDVLVVDPETDFTLPLNGIYQHDAFILTNRDFDMAITGIPIPFNVLQMRGQLGEDGRVMPGATLYAETEVLSIPTFGPYLVVAGLANNWFEKLMVMGTYVTRPYVGALASDAAEAFDDAEPVNVKPSGPANRRPEGIMISAIDYYIPPLNGTKGPVLSKAAELSSDGWVTVTFALEPGAAYPEAEHRPGIVLVDTAKTEAVYLDYHANLSSVSDERGNLAMATLRIPSDTPLPTSLKAVVILDVFPVYQQMLRE
jgi:outer membrane protein assembly factor BamB